ncbi:hypothetical protein ACPPVO_22445 [Dactylosporangium sp. McL0621]|uniref:hypothetical protein n=1 Tax=Dactylosporangium sp. McL0621 TaxID=3415678 RepID=UPI003CF3A4E4
MSNNLTADLVGAMFTASRDTTDHLIANLQATIADAEAHRQAVEHAVRDLLAGDHMPSPDAIRRAVFTPPAELVDHYRQEPQR